MTLARFILSKYGQFFKYFDEVLVFFMRGKNEPLIQVVRTLESDAVV